MLRTRPIASSTLNRPSTIALPTIAPASRRPATARRARATRSSTPATPPDATTGREVADSSAPSPRRSGPDSMPSRATEVATTAPMGSFSQSSRRSFTAQPDPASHPWAWASATPSSPTR